MQLEPYEAARQREDLRLIAVEVMDVEQVEHVPPQERGAIKLTGRLHTDPQAAYSYLAPRLRVLGYTALLQEDTGHKGPAETGETEKVALMAMPGIIATSPSRPWLPLLLFAFTIASTIFVGGMNVEGFSLGLGLAYSASLLSILLAHEFGHYLTARRMGVAVSYPFFIPMPLPPLGTMGAFISMKEPPPDRRALLAIAIAGPLAGLVVAIPVLVLGLLLSEVQTFEAIEATMRQISEEQGGESPLIREGNSLLYAGIKILVFGRFLPSSSEDVMLHPVAWAGWVGLLVTGLNLIPAGQLDGGHIFYSLFGARVSRIATRIIAVALFFMGLLWVGWLVWAVLILFLGRYRAPLLNELTPLDRRQRALAIVGLVIFVLVFTPAPLTLIELGT